MLIKVSTPKVSLPSLEPFECWDYRHMPLCCFMWCWGLNPKASSMLLYQLSYSPKPHLLFFKKQVGMYMMGCTCIKARGFGSQGLQSKLLYLLSHLEDCLIFSSLTIILN